MKKKIVILGPAYPYRGGLASFNERLALQFLNEGHEVVIYTFTLQYPNFLFPGKTQYSTGTAPENLKIERKVSSVNPFNWLKIGRELRKLKPDFLLFRFWLPFMGPCFGSIARLVKKNKHTKVIALIDNIIPHEKRTGDKPFTNYFLKPIDGFITMSSVVQKDLEKFDQGKPRFNTVHPIYDNFGAIISREKALTALNLDPNFRYLLFFGIIRDYKGLDLLLEAFSKINRKELGLKLLVAGEYYANEDKYQQLITSLKLNDDVIVVNNYIDDKEVGNYFCASDLVAQPYKNATQSGVTQIAYHYETPMIVTNVGGLPEMVPNQKVGYVVEVNSIDIKEAIEKFYQENKIAEFKLNLQEEKQKYSWEIMTSGILNLSEKI